MAKRIGALRTKNGCKQAGFTLIELMLVIAVIGILTAIAIPSFYKYRKSVYVTKTMTGIKGFEKGFIMVSLEYGYFPDDSHIILPPWYGLEKIISVLIPGRGLPLLAGIITVKDRKVTTMQG